MSKPLHLPPHWCEDCQEDHGLELHSASRLAAELAEANQDLVDAQAVREPMRNFVATVDEVAARPGAVTVSSRGIVWRVPRNGLNYEHAQWVLDRHGPMKVVWEPGDHEQPKPERVHALVDEPWNDRKPCPCGCATRTAHLRKLGVL